MKTRLCTISLSTLAICRCLLFSELLAQQSSHNQQDTAESARLQYDPFGPDNAADYLGEGAGGIVTPSPHDNIVQTYFTKANPDYFGFQYMRDSPFQVAAGIGWSEFQTHSAAALLKVRGFLLRTTQYDDIRKDEVPSYYVSFDGSLEHPFGERDIRSAKIRLHGKTTTEGLGLAGVGALSTKWNLLMASDRPLDRRLDIEATWLQLGGGYIMPLSPRASGVNLAVCFATDLVGLKYQTYYSALGTYFGAKIGSLGWMIGVGVNAFSDFNLTGCFGGEWSFSIGNLHLPTNVNVLAEIGRTTLFLGGQAAAGWLNLTGGIQMEWEYLDNPHTAVSTKAIRYYFGISIYCP